MTQFTRIMIDPNHRHTRWAMQSLERLHAIVARSVESQGIVDSRAIWRLDAGRTGKPCRLYIVSGGVPDATVLHEEFGVGPAEIATCAYEPFLDGLSIGQEWGFRLKANPTKSIASGDLSRRGRRVGLVRVEDQLNWLYRKACESGFHMPINRLEMPEVMVRDSGLVDFARKGGTVTLASATYDGVLAVDDPELLRKALTSGIGRAKGYGFGLLTLVPLPKRR
ncbi:type I-E CRISPR-associated protein Cas6/Cse3/CasE [Bifidobacterium callimiconis]|uniref:type I-E CRISPR-associated protein Cas6/Cse3/CasE n=1 Tax=Bifidobacterium callimiconis TaxID=2306973 RepID=UPI001BDBC6F5|nr:type I-E CRISPR-associated protein Cas6/Cse3/CasE [Bifidobacterium callimiconis]MBT1176072.1 type I-E CRISPR-associated protein Cas6/Cse3/CasE [Bifidobacterium callimiconis]